MPIRIKSKDPMKNKTPQTAFYDFYNQTYPSLKHNFEFRRFIEVAFMAGVAWSHARIKTDIESDLKDIADTWLPSQKE